MPKIQTKFYLASLEAVKRLFNAKLQHLKLTKKVILHVVN